MNRIEMAYRFPEIERQTESYLEDFPEDDEWIGTFEFRTIAELKAILREKAEGTLTEEALTEIAKTVFRSKPENSEPVSLPEGRQVVDFIYQM